MNRICNVSILNKEGVYMKPEMKFQPTIEKILFTLLFTVGEMK